MSKTPSRAMTFRLSVVESAYKFTDEVTAVHPDFDSPDEDYISKLPVELQLPIFECLPTNDDVGNLRRASKAWAATGTAELFPNGLFEIKPYRDDMRRLEEVSGRPWLARYITQIKIYLGDYNTSNPFWKTSHVRTPGGATTVQPWNRFRRLVKIHSDNYCDALILGPAFRKLQNLRSMAVTSLEFPFSKHETWLRDVWRDVQKMSEKSRMPFLDINLSIWRYISIFSAIQFLDTPLLKADFDMFPLVQFQRVTNIPPIALTNVLASSSAVQFGDLRQFRLRTTLGSIIAEFPCYYLGENFSRYLGSMQSLRNIDLHWPGKQDNHGNLTLQSDMFYNNLWPFLECLRISGNVGTTYARFIRFLSKHNRNLKCLFIQDYDFETDFAVFRGHLKSLCTTLRTGMLCMTVRVFGCCKMNNSDNFRFPTRQV